MAKGRKTGGRKRGSRNKTTVALKESILEALDSLGGIDYLVGLGKDNPTAFATLLGKVLPLTVAGDDKSPLKMLVEWQNASKE